VRDPQGGVFISDGEAVAVPEGANLLVKGYFICLTPDTLYVLPAGNG
jgi:hypothetical protein